MNILIVTTYFEPNQGATSVLLSRLARQLHERGHQITVLTTFPHYPLGRIPEDYKGKWVNVENRDGVIVIQTWLWATPSARISRKFLSQISFMLSVSIRGLSTTQPDIIFIEAQPIFTSLAGYFLSRLKKVPYILNISDLWPDHLLTVGKMTETHPVYRLARIIVDHTYRCASGIVSASPGWDEAIKKYIGETNKTKVIYYGTDLKRFRPNLDTSGFREKYKLGDGKLITFIGTFATQYDFDAMFATAANFRHDENLTFVFIGSGSQSADIQKKLEEESSLNIVWLNWIDHSEMPAAWNASYITFWALRNQALYKGTIPGKLYEAMACGIPIIAATEDVPAQIIAQSNGGVAVQFEDIKGMTDAISKLLDNPDLRETYSQNARRYAEKYFDSEKLTSSYEKMLLNIVQSPNIQR